MSLGLVAYESSDESDNDDLSPPGINEVTLPNKLLNSSSKKDSTKSKLESPKKRENSESSNSYVFEYDDGEDNADNTPLKKNVLSSLPAPKIKLHELDIDVKKLKSSGTVKISIPSLSQLDSDGSDELPLKKKLKPSQKGSGLFSLLPSPKNHGLAPQSIVNRKPAPNDKPKSVLKPRALLNPAPVTPPASNETKISSLTDYDDSGEEDNLTCKENGRTDFFSLNKDNDLPLIPIPENTTEEQSSVFVEEESKANVALTFKNDIQPSGWSKIKTPATKSSTNYSVSSSSYPNSQDFMPVENEDLELNEEALQHLCGRRDRNKMQSGNMQLIDVSGDAIMPDSREWLTKQLTEETNNVQSHKRKDGPTSQQRRKHQITYLAFQAKEHELELKNQWANNRVSRKQTQAKYGF